MTPSDDEVTEKELIAKKISLKSQKTTLQNRLSEIGLAVATRMPTDSYRKIQIERKKLVIQVTRIDWELNEIKDRFRDLVAKNGGKSAGFWATREVVIALVELRENYNDVAAGEFDIHGPAERTLAAQFVRDLSKIIRRLCEPQRFAQLPERQEQNT